MDSRNSTAIVTGAAKRVGAVVAEALQSDGWTVVAHVHHEGDTVGPGMTWVAADLGDADCAERIFAAAEGLPPVRLLVNNAARFAGDSVEAFSAREFDAHMAINVRSPALLTEAFAQRCDGHGLIVNLLDAKLKAPNPDFLSYTLSKYALAALTELSARALADRGIRVCGIAPALMLQSPGQSAANFEAARSHNPLRRGVEPGDVVAALRYLIEANSVTGEVLTIDGGQHFWQIGRDVQFLEMK
ncbi:MAG TPA: SDR family oxidoreductase [Sphingomicrobium sp.]|nr:SDR family oxidoreductase [Sphingomicrobium sp.]